MGTLPENMMLSIPSWSTEERRRAETWAWPDQGDDVEHSSPAATSEESTIAWGISKIKDNLISFNGTGVDIIRADRGQLGMLRRVARNKADNLKNGTQEFTTVPL